jgi:hypothetical protein
MVKKSYLRESELRDYPNLHDLKVLESREDVSTLLDIYTSLEKEGITGKQIVTVKEDNGKNYYFVVSERRSLYNFDIISFIDSRYSSRKVTNANIKLLFPLGLSRGIGGDSPRRGSGVIPKLYYEKGGALITVPREGAVTIGRSEKRSNYVIAGNNNLSRVHCKVFYDRRDGALRLEDCNSSKGTYLNGRKVGTSGELLEVGDVITLAGEKILVSN